MKKLTAVMILIALILSPMVAKGEVESKVVEVEETKPDGTVEVVWWTFHGKTNVGYFQKVIDAFNASQDDYHVTIEYQGSQNELIAKMQSTLKNELPALFHCAIENIGMVIEADYAVSAQPYVDKDKAGWPELANTYESFYAASCDGDGNLVGYPSGVSYPTIYYNADMLAKAGIDPASLTSFEKVLDACRKLVNGGYAQYGIGFHTDAGYYVNAALAREGVIAYDNKNGLEGNITKCLYKDGGVVESTLSKYLGFYKDLYKENLGVTFGANYSSEIIPLMAAEDCAMMLGVISMTTKLLTVVDNAFEVGVIPCPSVTEAGTRAGEPSGGTWLFIADNGNKWAMQGGYEFMKFASKGEWAGYFAAATGYLAPSVDAFESEVYQNYMKNIFPGINTVYQSLESCKGDALMPICGVSAEIKNANKLAVETVCNDPTDATIAKAIKTAYDQIQEAIDLYNLAN
ncbi:MAG TPA: extracellular solute-binding protein [Sphaerochaeta sp.]|jgi:ABC-type glycerol-3-phosphate transport system substrate-binding protein|nr:extracellular solute-binding protein [Sphaerochaeta sp.]